MMRLLLLLTLLLTPILSKAQASNGETGVLIELRRFALSFNGQSELLYVCEQDYGKIKNAAALGYDVLVHIPKLGTFKIWSSYFSLRLLNYNTFLRAAYCPLEDPRSLEDEIPREHFIHDIHHEIDFDVIEDSEEF